ncbi:MAG: hypothetical protein JWP25_8960 [Bradyrhizobium sp.]|nr:hypothetical protein [Bradyrhizobium sp.]
MAIIDAYGQPVPSTAPTYVAWIQWFGGAPVPHSAPNPGYTPGAAPGGSSGGSVPPHLQFSFDTIGQVIPATLGHCRLALKTIWVKGIDASGQSNDRTRVLTNTLDTPSGNDVLAFSIDSQFAWAGSSLSAGNGGIPDGTKVTDGTTTVIGLNSSLKMSAAATKDILAGSVITFLTPLTTFTAAYALCAPLDPTELGDLVALYDGSSLIFTPSGGITPPAGWNAADSAQLINSLSQITIYPGDEEQEPDPLILADRGAAIANAFRGIRYVVIPDYPATGGMPNLSAVYNRTGSGKSSNITAVQFGAGGA